jgi:hypothetical protein
MLSEPGNEGPAPSRQKLMGKLRLEHELMKLANLTLRVVGLTKRWL